MVASGKEKASDPVFVTGTKAECSVVPPGLLSRQPLTCVNAALRPVLLEAPGWLAMFKAKTLHQMVFLSHPLWLQCLAPSTPSLIHLLSL